MLESIKLFIDNDKYVLCETLVKQLKINCHNVLFFARHIFQI
jgi:hypothetical protein